MSYQPLDSEEKPIKPRSLRWLWAGIASGAASTGIVLLNDLTLDKSEVLRDLTFWPVYIACIYVAFGPSTRGALLNILTTAILALSIFTVVQLIAFTFISDLGFFNVLSIASPAILRFQGGAFLKIAAVALLFIGGVVLWKKYNPPTENANPE